MARRKRLTERVCADCLQPVVRTGSNPYVARHGVTGREVPMLAPSYAHEADADHDVARTTWVAAKASSCRCCGADGKGLCDPCREAHGSNVSIYIASLRCPVKEAADGAHAEFTELFAPGSTLPVFLGHSEECFTTPPSRMTDEITAACPKCSVPVPVREQRELTPAQIRAWAHDTSNGPRAGRVKE